MWKKLKLSLFGHCVYSGKIFIMLDENVLNQLQKKIAKYRWELKVKKKIVNKQKHFMD